MNFLTKLKLFLYALSFVQIFVLGYIGRADDDNIQVMYIALALLALNVAVYAIIRFIVKKREKRGK
ncbi:MAG: hypothetical protein FWD54_07515 [Endomicrobia bacterium]|nr:hypothetical protein [Endomicrobiia bacterium]MCL2800099.1 hypothetical protein [Endomicrobiia bacterium]